MGDGNSRVTQTNIFTCQGRGVNNSNLLSQHFFKYLKQVLFSLQYFKKFLRKLVKVLAFFFFF